MPPHSVSALRVPPAARAQRSPTWLLIAPWFDGHHYPYLEHLVEGALARGYRAVVGIGDDEQGLRTRAALADRVRHDGVELVSAPVPPPARGFPRMLGMARDELRRLGFLEALFEEARKRGPVDHVFLPYMDWTLFAIALARAPFKGTRYSGITMRQRFHLRASGVTVATDRLNAVKAWLFRRLLRDPALDTIFTNDETLPEYFAPTRFAGKVVHFADPSDPRPEMPRDAARRRLGIAPDACVVLVYGYLDARKGIRDLLAWIAGSDASSTTVLLAGRQAPEVRTLLELPDARRLAEQGRLRTIDAFVPEDDEPLYFGAADLVWLAYERFEMMSGVLVKAAQYRRTVVFREYGLVAHYARRHGSPLLSADGCGQALAGLPAGLSVRTFEAGQRARPLPEHSWSHTLQLIYG
jgi:hypothetical protein